MKTLTVTPNFQYGLAIQCEAKDNPLGWQENGLSFTASGYGKRIPTTKMIKYKGK